ncbi:MAG: alpha/beta hydrolase [Myxococcales bacterium]|nr:alpha/beta hydrolase [Myxococcales bacterium]
MKTPVPSLYERAHAVDAGGSRLCVSRLGAAAPALERTVILLHGNPTHMDIFRELAPPLRSMRNVVAFDHPGLGRSDAFRNGVCTLERSAMLVPALLDALDIRGPVDLIGQSHGAMVAVTAAALVPDRIRSVTLLASGGTPAHGAYRLLRGAPGMVHWLPPIAAGLYGGTSRTSAARTFTRLAVRGSFHPHAAPGWFVDDEVTNLRGPTTVATMVALALDNPCEKVAGHIGQVQCPLLMVHGEDDELVDIKYARNLWRKAPSDPRGRFRALPNAGHMLHITHRDELLALLDTWWPQCDQRAG